MHSTTYHDGRADRIAESSEQVERQGRTRRRRRRRISTALAVLAFAFAVSGCLSPDQQLALNLVNLSRGSNGRPLLAEHPVATAKAQDWSVWLAASGSLRHQDLGAVLGASGARAAAENVGFAGSVEDAHRAFWSSAPHRANILGDYSHVGTGVTRSGGRVYTVHVFLRF
ncbi:MAG: hypothetical protein KatS3mg010_1538 [Acidimicrobiia bacterium]|nr:MAG: hypothetical protein KatS3mg010_1538 [Acidimicrobiia bacterium]